MQKNANEFLLRCSAIGDAMSDPQSKSPADVYAETVAARDKSKAEYETLKVEKPHLLLKATGLNLKDKIIKLNEKIIDLEPFKDDRPLSSTCMGVADIAHREIHWNRRQQLKTKYIRKGNIQEDEVLSLFSRVKTGQFTFLERNLTRFPNETVKHEFLTGMPDIHDLGIIVPTDLKGSWGMETLPGPLKKLPKAYDYQDFGYLDILKDVIKTDTWTTFFGLVNTPPVLIEEEMYSRWRESGRPIEGDRAMGLSEDWIEIYQEIERKNIWDMNRFITDLQVTHYPYQLFHRPDAELYERIKSRSSDAIINLYESADLVWTFDVPDDERWTEVAVKWTQERQDEVYARVKEIRQYVTKAYPKHWVM